MFPPHRHHASQQSATFDQEFRSKAGIPGRSSQYKSQRSVTFGVSRPDFDAIGIVSRLLIGLLGQQLASSRHSRALVESNLSVRLGLHLLLVKGHILRLQYSGCDLGTILVGLRRLKVFSRSTATNKPGALSCAPHLICHPSRSGMGWHFGRMARLFRALPYRQL